VRLLLNLETPQALSHAVALGQADERVMGFQLGLGDLFEPLGIDRRDVNAVHHIMMRVRLAAGEAGISVFDGAFADVNNTGGFIAEAQMAQRLGFAGKSCIHPRQVPLANQVFRPSDQEIADALKVVKAAGQAYAEGLGAFMVGGKMIDAPFLMRAQAIVAVAERLNLVPR
jgi:citrate lyase beta subunit